MPKLNFRHPNLGETYVKVEYDKKDRAALELRAAYVDLVETTQARRIASCLSQDSNRVVTEHKGRFEEEDISLKLQEANNAPDYHVSMFVEGATFEPTPPRKPTSWLTSWLTSWKRIDVKINSAYSSVGCGIIRLACEVVRKQAEKPLEQLKDEAEQPIPTEAASLVLAQ